MDGMSVSFSFSRAIGVISIITRAGLARADEPPKRPYGEAFRGVISTVAKPQTQSTHRLGRLRVHTDTQAADRPRCHVVMSHVWPYELDYEVSRNSSEAFQFNSIRNNWFNLSGRPF